LPRVVPVVVKIVLLGYLTIATFAAALCQTASDASGPLSDAKGGTGVSKIPSVDRGLKVLPHSERVCSPLNSDRAPHWGLIVRSLKRVWQDQQQLYSAPFERSHIQSDVIFLSGTGALLATDRPFSRALPTNHLDASRNISNISLDATSAALVGLWAYGIKTGNRHAKETGELALETLTNTFLIYTPMQFAAGRERPEEGTGNGRFWRHAGLNTSFPAGHPMFTWTMASVVAHEYPRKWVRLLAYGAATSVSAGRLLGREHFASDVLVGSVLGYLIGAHIFHAHCQPGLSEACHR